MDNYLSVAQVNSYVKAIFDNDMLLKNICVYGEVSSYNISNGIAYFNLKDGENLLSCVLFNALKFNKPQLGDMVLLTGSMSYYTKGGRLSFNAVSIAPYGRGILYEQFLKLKEDLEKQGYFDSAHKKRIPDRVKRIGVVTSPTGAVIQDIIDVTTRRNNGIDIVLYPVKVQGVGAEVEIAKGINFFSTYDKVDVVIVARGGGSLEDLQPFNTLEVAQATYDCQKPIVSAVGHETDYTIIDFVSDLRAPTPSAAAELVAWDKRALIDGVMTCLTRISTHMDNKIKIFENLIDKNYYTLYVGTSSLITSANASVDKMVVSYENAINSLCAKCESTLNVLSNSLNKLNPTNVLDRGYAKVLHGGSAITSVNSVKESDVVDIQLKDGKITSVVKKVEKR